jgi:hypothetical protein
MQTRLQTAQKTEVYEKQIVTEAQAGRKTCTKLHDACFFMKKGADSALFLAKLNPLC